MQNGRDLVQMQMAQEEDEEGDQVALRKISTVTNGSEAVIPPLWGSCRLLLAMMCLLATLLLFMIRINLSFAMVCMVQPQTGGFKNSSVTDDFVPASNLSFAANEVHLAWDKETQGGILGAFYYGYIVPQILGGWISDRVGGGKLLLLVGLGTMSILTLLTPPVAQASSTAFFAVRVIMGVASGLSQPAFNTLFSRWASPAERGTLLGVVFAGFTIASSLTFPFASMLCQYGFAGGWPSVFYVSGILGIAWCVGAYWLVYDNPALHPRISRTEKSYLSPFAMSPSSTNKHLRVPWCEILKSVPVQAVNVTHFCLNWGFYTLVINLPMYMRDALDFDITQNGLLSAMPYAAALVVHLMAGKAFDALRQRNLCSTTRLRKVFNTIGFAIPAACMFSVGQLTSELRYLAVVLIAISQAGVELAVMGGFMLTQMDMAPQYAGVLMGISNTLGTVPGFVSPLLVAYLTKDGNKDQWLVVFYIAGAMYLLGVLVYGLFGSSEKQPWAMDAYELKQALQEKAKEKNGTPA